MAKIACELCETCGQVGLVGEPCECGEFRYEDVVRIEDDDDAFGLNGTHFIIASQRDGVGVYYSQPNGGLILYEPAELRLVYRCKRKALERLRRQEPLSEDWVRYIDGAALVERAGAVTDEEMQRLLEMRTLDPRSALRYLSRDKRYDEVQKARHYESHPSGVAAVELLELLNWNLGTVLKYIWRADDKGAPVKDLQKACWYLKRHMERGRPLLRFGRFVGENADDAFQQIAARVLAVEPADSLLAEALRALSAESSLTGLLQQIESEIGRRQAQEASLLPSEPELG
jgi:hypothetical protein